MPDLDRAELNDQRRLYGPFFSSFLFIFLTGPFASRFARCARRRDVTSAQMKGVEVAVVVCHILWRPTRKLFGVISLFRGVRRSSFYDGVGCLLNSETHL